MLSWFFRWFDNLKMQHKIVPGVIIVTLLVVVPTAAVSGELRSNFPVNG